MRYRGNTRTTELAVSPHIIGQLVLEAEFRDLKLGELVARLITALRGESCFKMCLSPVRGRGRRSTAITDRQIWVRSVLAARIADNHARFPMTGVAPD